jgi:hypothetical protein
MFTQRWFFVCITLACFTQMLGFVDPVGVLGHFPIFFSQLLFGAEDYLVFAAYCAILLHWIEIYNTSVALLERETMLSKINAKYKANISIEAVLKKVTFGEIRRLYF